MWNTLLDRVLRRFIRTGTLSITYTDGRSARYGDGTGDPVHLRFKHPTLARRFVLRPELTLGEAWVDREFEIVEGTLSDLFRVLLTNQTKGTTPFVLEMWDHVQRPVQKFFAHNRVSAARANVNHHYDLSGELYDLFLDRDRQYSCAYFPTPDTSLEEAQEAKKHHIARKLRMFEGARVLDIGCGWGGMALTLARDYGAHVTGITLSDEQYEIARRRAEEAGLADRIDIRKVDYRELTGTWDRIVSVGMFEHVGLPHYGTYFRGVRRLLAEDGVALIHTIGVNGPPQVTGEWIRRYIFPGGYLPALSEIVRTTEKARLPLADIEVLRDHYADTLQHWLDRFSARADRAREIYDERFVRIWTYYLTAAGASFRWGKNVVFQVQLARDKSQVPMTRDYLYRG